VARSVLRWLDWIVERLFLASRRLASGARNQDRDLRPLAVSNRPVVGRCQKQSARHRRIWSSLTLLQPAAVMPSRVKMMKIGVVTGFNGDFNGGYNGAFIVVPGWLL
jgi:hypothetical protein